MSKDKNNYLMYFSTVQGTSIKTLTETLKDVLTDINIHFTPEGVQIMNMNNYHTSFVSLKLNGKKFDEYYCPDKVIAGVNMMSFHKILKTVCNNDMLCMYIRKDAPDRLGIDVYNVKKKIFNRILYNLLDVDVMEITIPDVVYDATITMSCGDFQKYCRELVNFSEHVTFEITRDKVFKLLIDGSSASQLVSIEESENSNVVVELNDEVFKKTEKISIGKFSLRDLNLFCKSSTLCPNIRLHMKTDLPIIISYAVADLGTVKYCLSSISD